ncbi:hypothetical protein A9O67_11385 [Tepidimonas fonticaldi]|uniref:Acyltransferase 3 domain-containing protein n=1 Tax=Tepidimonas fonticaldi TaxID=1101373 RepID=A0A1A6DYQ9_9BURK|nr:hypothetical protein A9O67_11385 [Tepidimonas fonticaldi]
MSWERRPHLGAFARNRALRIYPALVVLCTLCVCALGPALTRLPLADYWSHAMTRGYWITASAWKVAYPLPGVFEHNPLPHAVNGSLWSLPYEVRCYLVLMLVAVVPLPLRWKVLGLLAVLTVVLWYRPSDAGVFDRHWGLDYYHIKLGWLFFCGSALAAWRQVMHGWRLVGLVMVSALLAGLDGGAPRWLLLWTAVASFIVWLARDAQWLPTWPERWGDWSYGVYLYRFPVQQTLAHWGVHQHGMSVYLLSATAVTLALGAASWHGVEKHALRWKA